MATRRCPAQNVCIVLPSEEHYSEAGGAVATVTRNVVRVWRSQGVHVTVVAPAETDQPYAEGTTVFLPQVRRSRNGDRVWLGRAVTNRLRTIERLIAPWGGVAHRPHRRAVVRALRLLSHPPDVIVLNNDPVLVDVARRVFPTANVVLWLHNEVGDRYLAPRRFFTRAAAVVAVSQYIATWTERHYHLKAGSVGTILNGVDLDRFHPRLSSRAEPQPIRVVCHGRIDSGKGYDLAVEAVARLRAAGHDIALTIAGGAQVWGRSASEVQSYKDLVLQRLASTGGDYLGRLRPDEVPAMLREHDIVCVPSRAPEGCSLSMLEGMASGLAVVASDCGGISEVITGAGTLIPPDDLTALTEALEELVSNRALLEKQKQLARTRSEALPWAITADRVLGAAT